MAIFTVHGPFNVPGVVDGDTLKFAKADKAGFWEEAGEELAHSKGCYLFCLRRRSGWLPWYVGMTSRSFYDECFTPHKREHYGWSIKEHARAHPKRRAKPVMFFLARVVQRGGVSREEILDLENHLIGLALKQNSNLSNVKGTDREPWWRIDGVRPPGRGRPSDAAVEFKKALGL